jgi:hypothetical protein
MYELALLETLREAFATIWSSLQWWASVSFGVMAVATFARDRLILPITVFLTALYSLFTAYTLGNGSLMIVQASGVIEALAGMRDSGELTTVGALTLQRYENPIAGLDFGAVFFGCFVATYVGTVAYLWFSYLKQSKGV